MSVLDLFAHPAAVSILTAVLAVITAVYALLTYRIARANADMIKQLEKQHESQTRPVIAANILIEHSVILVLVISNKGVSPALNVRLTLDRDFYRFSSNQEDANIRNFQAFQTPIPSMSPGDGLRFDLSQGFNLNKEVDGVLLTPLVFTLHASYRSATRSYEEEFVIDLNPYMNSNPPRHAVDELSRIEKHLKEIARKLGG